MVRHSSVLIASSAAIISFFNGLTANDNGNIGLFTGYRQDSANLSICSSLSDPAAYGFGKLKARNVHIWEIGAVADYNFTEHATILGSISWGEVLGGKLKDSGVADLNGNPWNVVIGDDYSACCCPPCAQQAPCDCGCDGQEFRPLTPVTARLSGNVWDANIGLSYQFNASENFAIMPSIGYAFNRQSYTYRQAQWGPIHMSYQPFPCTIDDDDIAYIHVANADIEGGTAPVGIAAYKDDMPYHEYVLPFGATYYWMSETDPVTAPVASATTTCLSIGNCFDGSNYRARWSGGFLGLDLVFAWQKVNFSLGYRAYLQNYSGRFKTGGACACNSCLSFYEAGKEWQNPPDGSWDEIISYSQQLPKKQLAVDSEMRFSSWAYGQSLNVAADWYCGPVNMGLYFDIGYRTAPGCTEVSPCASCEFVVNPALKEDVTAQYPIWSNATKRNARWNYLRAGIFAAIEY